MPRGLALGVAVEAAVACLLAPLALECCPTSRVLNVVARLPRRRGAPAAPDALAGFVDGVLRRLPGPWRHTCLRRAVALAALLRRDGREVQVRIGVRRDEGGDLRAHAWLRCDGAEPFLEDGPVDGFAILRPARVVS